MPAITAAYLALQVIAPVQLQAALADPAQMNYRLNRAEGTVSLIIRGQNQFNCMSTVLSFYAEPDYSRPYSFKPSDGVLKARCDTNQHGEIVGRVLVGSVRPDGEPIDEVLGVRCYLNQDGAVITNVAVGSMRPDYRFNDVVMGRVEGTERPYRPASLTSLPCVDPRDDRINGEIVESLAVRLMKLDSGAADRSSSLTSLPCARLRDDYLSGRFVR